LSRKTRDLEVAHDEDCDFSLHRFDTNHECDRQTDGRQDDGYDARCILLSSVKTVRDKTNVATVYWLAVGALDLYRCRSHRLWMTFNGHYALRCTIHASFGTHCYSRDPSLQQKCSTQ